MMPGFKILVNILSGIHYVDYCSQLVYGVLKTKLTLNDSNFLWIHLHFIK